MITGISIRNILRSMKEGGLMADQLETKQTSNEIEDDVTEL